MNGDFQISTDKNLLDIDFIHEYLSNQSYWAKDRNLELVKRSIENSMCFGVFDSNGKQVAFARIADYVVFAWMLDVFVDENHKGKGIGKVLIDYIINHKDLRLVNGIGLRTNDAHRLYECYGFKKIPSPNNLDVKEK